MLQGERLTRNFNHAPNRLELDKTIRSGAWSSPYGADMTLLSPKRCSSPNHTNCIIEDHVPLKLNHESLLSLQLPHPSCFSVDRQDEGVEPLNNNWQPT